MFYRSPIYVYTVRTVYMYRNSSPGNSRLPRTAFMPCSMLQFNQLRRAHVQYCRSRRRRVQFIYRNSLIARSVRYGNIAISRYCCYRCNQSPDLNQFGSAIVPSPSAMSPKRPPRPPRQAGGGGRESPGERNRHRGGKRGGYSATASPPPSPAPTPGTRRSC